MSASGTKLEGKRMKDVLPQIRFDWGWGLAQRKLLLALLLCFGIAGGSAADDQRLYIDYRDGLLSVDLENVRIVEILRVLEQRTGVAAQIDPSVDGRISARFSELPLQRGYATLLARYSHVLIADDAGGENLDRVIVMGMGEDNGLLPDANLPMAAETVATVAPQSQPAAVERRRELVLTRQRSGHYLADGRINGVPTRFLIDTGATTVAIPARLAARAGLVYGPQQMAHTAGGPTVTYETMVKQLTVGGLIAENIVGHVVPKLSNDYVLLGMTFLRAYDLNQDRERLVIRER